MILNFHDNTVETVKLDVPNGESRTHKLGEYTLWCRWCYPSVSGLDCFKEEYFLFLNGDPYCVDHYPKAVDVFLATERLKAKP